MGMELSQESSISRYTGLKVFSATKHVDRDRLGETVTEWLQSKRKEYAINMRVTHPMETREATRFHVVETKVTQSSDSEFHCVTITVFYFIAPLDGKN